MALAEKTSAYRLLSTKYSGVATIFVLHRVIREGEISLDPALTISEKFLDAAVSRVMRQGREIVSLNELVKRILGRSFSRPMVVFTFDDGYKDNGLIAAKIFERYGVPWTMYLTTGFPDRICSYWWGALEKVLLDNDTFELEMPNVRKQYRAESLAAKRAVFNAVNQIGIDSGPAFAAYLTDRYNVRGPDLLDRVALSWREIRQLLDGRMELGGHTITHPSLLQITTAEARREIAGCRDRIREMVGVTVSHFSAPYGIASDRDYALLHQEGYKTAAAGLPCNVFIDRQPGDKEMIVLPRIVLDGRNERLSQLDIHLSGLTGLSVLRTRHPALRMA